MNVYGIMYKCVQQKNSCQHVSSDVFELRINKIRNILYKYNLFLIFHWLKIKLIIVYIN